MDAPACLCMPSFFLFLVQFLMGSLGCRVVEGHAPKPHPPQTATLSPPTFWKSDLILAWTTLWTNPLICHNAREYAGALRLAFVWCFRSLEIMITMPNDPGYKPMFPLAF